MKIRCSSLGKIMTAPRSKSEVLSQTAKSYIEELAKEHLFGIKKVFKSRYTDKGNEVEEKAIELTEEVLGFEFLTKSFSVNLITFFILIFIYKYILN